MKQWKVRIIFGNRILFSNLNSNCSNLIDMRNLQEQVKKAFCYQKLFWPFTVWINCSSDLKNFANSRHSASNFKSFSRSQEHFFLTVGQNNFGNKIPFLTKLQKSGYGNICILCHKYCTNLDTDMLSTSNDFLNLILVKKNYVVSKKGVVNRPIIKKFKVWLVFSASEVRAGRAGLL